MESETINIEKIARNLYNVLPSTMSLEDRLERLPGAIHKVDEDIQELSTKAEQAKRTLKTLEDREFYSLKGTTRGDGKPYTIEEARHVAVRRLKKDNELYQKARADEQRAREEMAEKSRLRDFYERMNRNAEYLVKLKILGE